MTDMATTANLALPANFIAQPTTTDERPPALTTEQLVARNRERDRPLGSGLIPPSTLPVRLHDGRPITHLSVSAHNTYVACPEAYRRRYILGQKTPATPAMFTGTVVDHAVTFLAQAEIRGEQPEPGDVIKAYDAGFEQQLDEQDGGVTWTADETRAHTRRVGKRMLGLYLRDVRPFMGRPIAAQRKVEFKLHPHCDWVVVAYLDLETVRREIVAIVPDTGEVLGVLEIDGTAVPGAQDAVDKDGRTYVRHEREREGVRDYKVKNKLVSQLDTDEDFQGTVYLAGRDIEGRPAHDFALAVLRKPTKKEGKIASRIVTTERDRRRRKGALARFVTMANGIAALYAQIGPEGPWPLADPSSWKCSKRFCEHFARCPGGAGL
jgi:hypothetical protein